LAAEPVPAVVPLDGLLAGGEPAGLLAGGELGGLLAGGGLGGLLAGGGLGGLLAGGEPAGLLAGGEPAVAPPPDGLLAGGEPLDELPGTDAPPLAPVVVDPFEGPVPPPQAVRAAASAKAMRSSRVLMGKEIGLKKWRRLR